MFIVKVQLKSNINMIFIGADLKNMKNYEKPR